MAIDGFIIWVLVIAWFFVDRNDRQREIEDERARRDMGGFGRSQS